MSGPTSQGTDVSNKSRKRHADALGLGLRTKKAGDTNHIASTNTCHVIDVCLEKVTNYIASAIHLFCN